MVMAAVIIMSVICMGRVAMMVAIDISVLAECLEKGCAAEPCNQGTEEWKKDDCVIHDAFVSPS